MISIAASAALLMLTPATNPALASEQSSAVGDQFVCDSLIEGKPDVEIDAREIMMARAWHADLASDAPVELYQIETSEGFRFAGPGLLLEGKGERATLTNAYRSVACTRAPVSTAPEAEISRPIDSPVMSWGGKLRAGPGMTYAQVGSSFEGQQLRLLSDSGIAMNGYNWFRVRTRAGVTAYIWGGLLCSGGQGIAGLFEHEGCHVDGIAASAN